MRMVHGRGMDHVYSTRFVKYQGRAKISATFLDVYKRSSIFRVLSHGSISRIGLYEHYARNGSDVIRAKRSGTLENPFFSKSRSHFFAWLLDNPLPPSPILISYIDYYIVYNVTMGVAAMGPSTSRVDPNN